MKKLFTGLVAILSISSVLAGCADQSATTTAGIKTIKVGVIEPLSGPAAALGEQEQAVQQYELDATNARIASKGYKLELAFEDGKCTGTDAATAFQKLTDVDGVNFIIGGTCSSETLGFLPMFDGKTVMALSPTNSNPELANKNPNYHTLSYSDEDVGNGVADVIGSKYTRVAILTEQNDYNQALERVVLAALKAKYPNVQVVDDEQFPKGADEFRNVLQKVKASNPDIFFMNPNPGATTEALVRQLAELKDWKVDKVSIYGLMAASALSAAPEAIEGTIVVDAPKVNDQKFTDEMNKIAAAKGKLDDLGNYYVASTIDTLNVMADVIANSGADVEKANQMVSTGSFDGYLGKIIFNGHTFVQGIGTAKFVIKGGKALPFSN